MRKLLFFTHPESGQANVILSLALELKFTRSSAHRVLSKSFSPCTWIQPCDQRFNFHPLDGTDMVHTLPSWELSEESMKHPPVSKSWDFYDRLLVPALVVWGGQGSSRRVSLVDVTSHRPLSLRIHACI